MGGRMSFSAALLDDAGDGLVISAIHGRTETRTYAKGVKGGTSDQPLSPEERQAITYAMRVDPDVAAPGPAHEALPESQLGSGLGSGLDLDLDEGAVRAIEFDADAYER